MDCQHCGIVVCLGNGYYVGGWKADLTNAESSCLPLDWFVFGEMASIWLIDWLQESNHAGFIST